MGGRLEHPTPADLEPLHRAVLDLRWELPSRRDDPALAPPALEADLDALRDMAASHRLRKRVSGRARRAAVPVLVAARLGRTIGAELRVLVEPSPGGVDRRTPALTHPMLAEPLPLTMLEENALPAAGDGPPSPGDRSFEATMVLEEFERRWRFFQGVGRYAPVAPARLLSPEGIALVTGGYYG